MVLKLNCRYFVGEKPCRTKRLCDNCSDYRPTGKKILIVKLGAIGDVLRTTPILQALKKKFPESHITWLVDENGFEVLIGNDFIDRILVMNLENSLRLMIEEFELLICLDKVPKAVAIASIVKARKKFGYGLSAEGSIFPFNNEAGYSFELGISDELKFRINQKSYQQMIFEAIGLDYKKDEYIFNLTPGEVKFGKDFLKKYKICKDDLIIGLNTGCGNVFSGKKWTEIGFVQLAQRLLKNKNIKVLLLGGPEEVFRNKRIKSAVNGIIETGCNNTIRQFASLINCCDVVVTGDTIAMHLAIGLKKRTVAIFGPTCPQEIDLYGRGEKLFAGDKCAPCYKQSCQDMQCMKNISVEEAFKAVTRQLE